MKKPCLSIVVLFFIISLSLAEESQLSDSDLEKHIFVVDNGLVTAKGALKEALKRNRPDILLIGIKNPEVRSQALDAISNLPPPKLTEALIAVLKMDTLWAFRYDGNRAGLIQDAFVAKLQAIILKSTGIDSSSTNFFDPKSRGILIDKLAKSYHN